MKRNHLLLFTTLGIIVIIVLLYKVNVMPIVKDNDVDMQDALKCTYQKGELVNPLKEISKFGNLEIYIFIHRSDLEELPVDFPKRKVLYTNNRRLIEEVIDNFNFTYTSSDMSTCESVICVKSNDKVVYKANILISENTVGLQSSSSGWIESRNANNLIENFKSFDTVCKPIVII